MQQKVAMESPLHLLQQQQEHREHLEAAERNRLATREWWPQPNSSNTMAWVNSGGARGTSTQECQELQTRTQQSWRGRERAHSTSAQPASNITVDLADEEMELTLEELTAIKGEDNHPPEGDTLQGEVVQEMDQEHGQGQKQH